MSDDLVAMARLAQRDERMSTGALYGDLADRIEELEAKLAKAVEALETIAGPHNWASPHAGLGGSMDDDLRIVARTTLAELKGEDRG